MILLKKILFPTDFSRCAEQAYSYALDLAKLHNAELHILHAAVLHGYLDNRTKHSLDNLEEMHRQSETLASSRLSSIMEDPDAERVDIKHVQRRGMSAAPVILDYINEEDIDLLVMGTHGRRGLGHIALGSVAEELVRVTPCPVLTVRELETPRSLKAIEKVLAPLDFSDHSRRALVYAKELASSYQASLQLLHIVEPPVYPSFYALKQSYFFDKLGDIEQESKRRLRQLMEETAGPDVSFETFVLEGRAVTDISDFAEENKSDLVTIATHGLTGLKRLFLGSVTANVTRRAKCPVFTIRAFGKSLIRQ